MNPSLFVSHGPPNIPLDDVPARRFLETLGSELKRPTAILVISAHWMTDRPVLTGNANPETIHDFYGFPDALYRMRYPAPGAPRIAARAVELLSESGIRADLDESRGLDHGAWTPLSLMFPKADTPVIQLSIQPDQPPEHHIAVGRALRPLREEGVLIIGSGNVTHNLAAWREHRHLPDGEAPNWVTDFADWLEDVVVTGGMEALARYESDAPYGLDNHPSNDHFMPIFVAMGAGTDGVPGKTLHRSVSYGVLAMDAYAFH